MKFVIPHNTQREQFANKNKRFEEYLYRVCAAFSSRVHSESSSFSSSSSRLDVVIHRLLPFLFVTILIDSMSFFGCMKREIQCVQC